MRLLPCPFCGEHLVPHDHTGYAHPEKVRCFFSGVFIGIKRLENWNERSSGIFLDGSGDRPVFHDAPEPSTKPVDAQLLNQIIDWYEK